MRKLRWTFQHEVWRKVIHLGSLFYLVLYLIGLHFFNHQTGLLLLTALLSVMLLLEYWRLEWKWKIPIVSLFWEYKRPSEQTRLGGEIFFLLGALIALAAFDLQIALAAILMTTFGDLAACICGILFGKIRLLRGKKLEGSLAELIVNILVGTVILRSGFSVLPFAWGGAVMWELLLTMAITATVVETVLKKVDDNLVVPIIAGLAGQIVVMFL